MAEEQPAQPAAATGQQQPVQPAMRVMGQYIRDMSFENILMQTSGPTDVQPDVQVQVNLDGKKREQEHQFEVAIKLNITSKNKGNAEQTLFVMELDYVGVFHIENVPNEQLHPFLMIECPRMMFPFLRRIVSDVTRDGGFPPLNLENIDFMAMYRSELQRRAQAEAQQTTAGTA